jgi:hypothetical protein
MSRARNQEGCELNMTPMIDVVFNLIIFFMVITDMSQKDLEFLVLPRATIAIIDVPPENRIIVNVVNPDMPDMQGRVDPNRPPIFYSGRQVTDLEELRKLLRRDADPRLNPEKTKPDGTAMPPVAPGSPPLYPSNYHLLIRCDQGQVFGWVQAIMQLCTFMPGRDQRQELLDSPLIYKIQVATGSDQPAR